MKTFPLICSIFIGLLTFTSCGPRHRLDPPPTQLQIREIQSREFDTNDMKLVIKTMMNVLQDDGFIIKNVVSDMGLLCAERHMDIEHKGKIILHKLVDGDNARWDKLQILEASANVSEFGTNTRVRINFQIKVLDNFGCPKEVKLIQDPKVYQQFFEQVSKALFIQELEI